MKVALSHQTLIKTIAYIKSEIGTNLGYAFFGDDDDIEEFDAMWNNETYKDALNLLASLDDVDLTNFKDVKDFLKESLNEGLDAKDKISSENMQEIDSILKKFAKGYGEDAYPKTLQDPVQTHAIYGIAKDRQKTAKEELKSLGATKFRVVGLNVCFDASKMI